jgi:hypothetical protein
MASLASLSTGDLQYYRQRVCVLDAKYARLLTEEQSDAIVKQSMAAVLCEIQMISQLISECEKECARQAVAATRPPVAATRSPVAVSRPPAAASWSSAAASWSSAAVSRPPVAVSRPPAAASWSSGAATRSPVVVSRPPVVVSWTSVAVSRPPVAVSRDDSPETFLEDFGNAVPLMPSSGVLTSFSNYVFKGEYLPVRGDGNCGLRAFLTALAARAGRHLPINPPGLLDWIFRLKPLMIQQITQMLSAGIIDARNLLSIPENHLPADASLNDYFALFLTDGYQITNFDFRVLASMFNLQINVIRQNTNGIDDVQCFLRHGNEIDLNIAQHICILQQHGHYVPLIQVDVFKSFKSIDYLHFAYCLGFTG